MSRRGAERGISSLEWLGMALLAGSVVGAITFSISSDRAGAQMGRALCQITGGQGCGSGQGDPGPGGGGPGGPGTGQGGGPGSGPGSGPGGSGGSGGASGSDLAAPCVGAGGAAGPVRGSVPVGSGSGLSVAVMGDGTYRVTSAASGSPTASGGRSATDPAATWVGSHLDATAATGTDAFLRGGGDSVWSVSSPQALADLVAAEQRQGWRDTVLGSGGEGSVVDSALGLFGGGSGLPKPSARFTDTSPEGGLSLNAYDQVKALDSGGVALGTLDHGDGTTTDYLGVTPETAGGSGDLMPLVLEIDRDVTGAMTAMRTVTDRDFTTSGRTAASDTLYITHVPVTGATRLAVGDFAASVGASGVSGMPSGSAGGPASFTSAATAFKAAGSAHGQVTRQQPSGTVAVTDPNSTPLEAGLKQVLKSAPPQSWNGTAWTARPSVCGS